MKRNNTILTLTTDLGHKDHYTGVLKGKILSQFPQVQLVDITHDIQSFNVGRAAFVLRNSAFSFPKGTVHLMGVSPEIKASPEDQGQEVYPLVMLFQGHYFIAADNGFFSLLTEGEEYEELVCVKSFSDPNYIRNPLGAVLTNIAVKLLKGASLDQLGVPTRNFRQAMQFAPVISENLIKGSVIHIDKYGNIITNIKEEDFERVGKQNTFIIYFRRKEYYIDTLSSHYGEVPPGERLAFFNADGFLEIAINQGTNDTRGGADTLFGVHLQEVIRVEFFPKGSKENFESLF